MTTNQYIYPKNPFTEGENVTVKVDPRGPARRHDLRARLIGIAFLDSGVGLR